MIAWLKNLVTGGRPETAEPVRIVDSGAIQARAGLAREGDPQPAPRPKKPGKAKTQ
jgi:hypothetical protein